MNTLITLIIILVIYFGIRSLLMLNFRTTTKSEDGRTWSINLNTWLLGYKNPECTKDEGKHYKFWHVQVINFMLKFFRTGWHVPTDCEWTNTVSYYKEKYGADYFKELVSDLHILPAGLRYNNGNRFISRGRNGIFWSASVGSSSPGAWDRQFYYGLSTVYRGYSSRSVGFSVRCVKK